MVALQVYDQRMTELPNVGIIRLRDAESNEEIFVDTSSSAVRRAHHEWWINHQNKVRDMLSHANIDSISVRTDEDYVKTLINLFRRRS